MSDTTQEATMKQIEILLSKPEGERFRIGDELSAFGIRILESSIRDEITGISETDLKTEVFRRCYLKDFSPEEMNLILESMRHFLNCTAVANQPAKINTFRPSGDIDHKSRF